MIERWNSEFIQYIVDTPLLEVQAKILAARFIFLLEFFIEVWIMTFARNLNVNGRTFQLIEWYSIWSYFTQIANNVSTHNYWSDLTETNNINPMNSKLIYIVVVLNN